MRPKREGNQLSDQLNQDLLKQLKEKKISLKERERDKEEQERQKRIKQMKDREANKSFEELLNESELDWEKFKK
ncbi:YqkE family protein [Halobacillus sp. A5]|uniref:YqkE family protein n=1 Tax=Halobacillus sp. A5 TaxID=2880263 RepID=UPI0020A6D516|nr:YqkE family protein [Halobacillus sp. A5]MCP3025782.1 YqkE family protein [Halobacillus sp. A5]